MTAMTTTAFTPITALSPGVTLRNTAVAGVALIVGLIVGTAVLLLSALALPYDWYLRSRRR